jgi:hypothetical protein
VKADRVMYTRIAKAVSVEVYLQDEPMVKEVALAENASAHGVRNPSLLGGAQRQDSLATEPSDLGRAAAYSLATRNKCDRKPDSIPFVGGSKKLAAFIA